MKSISPLGRIFEYECDDQVEMHRLDSLPEDRKTVVVQGLGFVGAAMVAALAQAEDDRGKPLFNVIGVDQRDEKHFWKIAMANEGLSPVKSVDGEMAEAYQKGFLNKNLVATYVPYAYLKADVVVIDIHLDIMKSELGNVDDYQFSYDHFKNAIQIVADHVKENVLIVLETTVPPGTTENVVYPLFKESFVKRGLDCNKLSICHSYERVMPGKSYLKSITDYYRVYSGLNEKSNKSAQEFFNSFINVNDYPLSQMHSPNASEMAKVLENSFRAMNIAFIQEWTEFADKAGVDLFEVIGAIRQRPTHRNIMRPGFGVGGYCLTKDPLLADWAYLNHFSGEGPLWMSREAVKVNDLMPKYTFKRMKEALGNLSGKKILMMGVSYLEGVDDTRYSPSEYFYNMCQEAEMIVDVHDPLVSFWSEKQVEIKSDIQCYANKNYDIVVFCVRHLEYLNYGQHELLAFFGKANVFIDANDILSQGLRDFLVKHEKKVIGIGKGHWNSEVKNK